MKYLRPMINIEVFEIFGEDKIMMWNLFKKHHYLSDVINKAAHVFIAKWENKIIGFESILAFPHGSIKRGWREHRLVILSDFQGLGIGISLSECIGELLIKEGKRFYSKTANIKLGEYRNKSTKWRNASHSEEGRKRDAQRLKNGELKDKKALLNQKLLSRKCYSHEYIGDKNER